MTQLHRQVQNPSTMVFEFSTKPHNVSDLPLDTKEFVQDADSLVNEITSKWHKSKNYKYKLATGERQDVQTYYTHLHDEYWMARHSVIDATKHSWDEIMKYSLGARRLEDGSWTIDDKYTHTEYEIQYTKVLDKWGKVELESYEGFESLENKEHLRKWGSTWSHYELGAPLTTREFVEFILLAEPGYIHDDCAYVIQLVANHPVQSSHVHGVYCSIERFKLNKDNTIDWIMCTASDSGGNVPKWLQNSMIAKSVSHDVPMFLDWITAERA